MQGIAPFVHRYGYPLLLVVGFVEYAGIPIVSVPVLVTVGVLAGGSPLHFTLAALSAAAGAYAADAGWFVLARWKGPSVVGTACALSSNPEACVLRVIDQIRRIGPRLIVPSKFLPAVGNLMAPAAGFAGLGPGTFLPLDAVAVLLWALAYVGLGRLLEDQVVVLVAVLERARWIALIGVAVLLVGAVGWRLLRLRAHRREHAGHQTAAGDPRPDSDGADPRRRVSRCE